MIKMIWLFYVIFDTIKNNLFGLN